VYVDERVVTAHPGLEHAIHTWFQVRERQGVRLAARPQVISGGEAAKADLGIVERIGRTCADLGIDRHSHLIIIGGGAVLDAVGFAASLIHRGIRQIRLPTTTLAQADAGLGVKNAINAFGNKNFLGTFTPPWAIINDARFLEALDDRSWRCGIAEAVKVAIIKDLAFFARLEAMTPLLAQRDAAAMTEVVRRSAELHLGHIAGSGDPFEQGSSRPLDFGHWSAHRLEIATGHRLLHGEAVAIGVALDACYAVEIGRLQEAEAARIHQVLAGVGFRLWDEELDLRDRHGQRAILAGLEQFRELLGGELTLAMPDGLGRQRDLTEFDPRCFERALARLRRWRITPSSASPAVPSTLG
jgi:3-dehydroquinate synthase